jgi:UDP-4-amino-4,6-dideoxy-N-acetyl-beta-L-altrosamine transaminase
MLGHGMGRRHLPYGRQSIDDADIRAVEDVLRGDWLTQGPAVARFEAALCEATGARHAIAVANGTAALHLAMLAAQVGPGDVVLVPTITFVATANAVRYAGGRPVLVDTDADTGRIDLAALERALAAQRRAGVRVRAVVPVDYAGTPADLVAVRALASQAGAYVIEDAAHSLGASYAHDGRAFQAAGCAHADMAILSFHPVKHITTGEGGAVTTNDYTFAQRLRDLRSHGIVREPSRLRHPDEGPWWYEQQSLGFNYRLSDLQCALGTSQLARLEAFVARRRALAARYRDGLADHPGVRVLGVPAGASSSYHLQVVRLTPRDGEDLAGVASRRRALFLRLRNAGIHPQVHYIPVHRQPDFVDAGLGDGAFPGAEALYAGCLSVPMHPGLRDEDVDRVIDVLRRAQAVAG